MLVGKPYSKSKTKIKPKTLEPEWNEEFDDKYRYEEGDDIIFEVFDYDKGGKCDLLGRVLLPGSEFHRPGGFDGALTLTDTEKKYEPKLQIQVYLREMPPVENSATTPPASATPQSAAVADGPIAPGAAAAGA